MLSWGVDNTSATPCTQLLEPSNYFFQCSQNEHDTNEKGPVGNKAAAQKCSYGYGGTLFIKLSKLIKKKQQRHLQFGYILMYIVCQASTVLKPLTLLQFCQG